VNILGILNRDRTFRFLRFATVGGSVAVIDFSAVAFFSRFSPPLISVTIAYFIAACCHFLLNKFWVFRCRRSDYARQLVQYCCVILINWLITIAVVHFSLSSFTSNVLIAKLCAIPCATMCNFLLMQTIVFRKHAEQPEEDQVPYTSAAELD
jgi:putative flippase GtrA